MAVEDKYINSDLVAGKKGALGRAHAGEKICMIETFEISSADSATSVYRVFKNLNPELIPVAIRISTDALGGSCELDMGLHISGVAGAEKDEDVFSNGYDASGAARDADFMNTPVIENLVKPLYEHAGDSVSTKESGYDMTVTLVAVAASTGTVTIKAEFINAA